MVLCVLRSTHKLKIFNSIINRIMIDMMNMLIAFKLSFEVAFHNISMLMNSNSININSNIFRFIFCRFHCFIQALFRTKLSDAFSRWGYFKYFATLKAFYFYLSIIRGFLSCNSGKSFYFSGTSSNMPKTCPGTAFSRSGSIG